MGEISQDNTLSYSAVRALPREYCDYFVLGEDALASRIGPRSTRRRTGHMTSSGCVCRCSWGTPCATCRRRRPTDVTARVAPRACEALREEAASACAPGRAAGFLAPECGLATPTGIAHRGAEKTPPRTARDRGLRAPAGRSSLRPGLRPGRKVLTRPGGTARAVAAPQ
jgi:hypothetical protein